MATRLPNFDDRSAWVKVEDVNVFGEHTARHPKTGKFFAVDKARLERIAERCNARDAKGQLCVLFPGHTLADERDENGKVTRKIPESEQPAPLGYAREFKVAYDEAVGTHVVRACYYLPADREAEARSYPRVSAEYYADADEIDAVALLRRAPKLDLGQWTYGRGSDEVCLRYEMESNMMGDPAAPPSQGAPDMALKEQIMAALKEMLPQMLQELAMAQAPPPGAAPPPAPAAAPQGGPPPAGDDLARMEREQRESLAARYEREMKVRDQQIAELQASVANSRREAVAAQRERRLAHKRELGYDFDMPAVMAYARDLDPEQYEAFEKVFFGPQGCALAPIASSERPMLATPGGPAGRNRADEFTDADLQVALQYQRDHQHELEGLSPQAVAAKAEEYAKAKRRGGI